MRRIDFTHQQLRNLVKFTDPLIHTLEKEEEILNYFTRGQFRPPSLVPHCGKYLIFNGNHRILVAMNNKLTIPCLILETLDDILLAQQNEGEDYRDLSHITPLTYEGIVSHLQMSAEQWEGQDPDRFLW